MARWGYCLLDSRDEFSDIVGVLTGMANAQNVFSDTVQSDGSPRQGWSALLAAVEPGDEIVVLALSELGSTMKEFFSSISQLSKLEARLVTAAEAVEGAPGRDFHFFDSAKEISECLNQIASRKIRSSVESAKKKGGNHGRPKKVTAQIFEELLLKAKQNNLPLVVLAKLEGFAQPKQIEEILGMFSKLGEQSGTLPEVARDLLGVNSVADFVELQTKFFKQIAERENKGKLAIEERIRDSEIHKRPSSSSLEIRKTAS